MEENEFTKAKTSVWWDIENCCVPKGCDTRGIAQTLSLELMKMNYCGPLTISSYGNTDLIPNPVQHALSSTGIALNHVPPGKKEASDKKILADMFLWVMDNPAPANLMLITGDGDFSDALHKLSMRRYNILLVHPEQVSPSLVACAKTTWIWRSLWGSVSPVVTPGESSRLVEKSKKPMDSVSDTSRTVRNHKLKGVFVPKASKQIVQHETMSKKSQMKQNLELLGETKNMAASPSECLEKDIKMKNKVVEATLEAGADRSEKTSLDSNTYMKCLKKQDKQMREPYTTSERSDREFWQDFKDRMESEGGDFQVPKEVREYFDSILKKQEPSKDEIVTEKLEEMPKHGLEMKTGEPEKALAGPTEHLDVDMNKKKKRKNKKEKKKSKVIEDGAEAEAYVCSLCNVVCDCPTVFESHLKGRKHAAMINKQHTEALTDGKQIQDNEQLIEAIEDLRFQPQEEHENIDFSEWLNKGVGERNTTSKSSIEEYFQTLEEGPENENRYLQFGEGIFFEQPRESSFDDFIKKLNISANSSWNLEDLPKQNVEMSWSDGGGTSEHVAEYMDKNKDEDEECRSRAGHKIRPAHSTQIQPIRARICPRSRSRRSTRRRGSTSKADPEASDVRGPTRGTLQQLRG